MNSSLKHPLRVAGRLFWLGSEMFLAALNYGLHCAFCSRDSLPSARATWLQSSSRRVLRVFRIEIRFDGHIPSKGLLVCNHLSYLDILVLAAIVPCLFVAKQEVKYWPVFGWFAKLAGTVFVQRERRTQAGRTVDEIETVLQTAALVVLFPEGTSSDGQTVLPFKSSLLEPAVRQAHPLSAGLIQYALGDGDVGEEVCYWKDMTLVPHLINLCSKRTVQASVSFKQLREGNADRKQLARQLHAEVLRMKHAFAM
ncbi:MAG TPA: lysophospholipid acyltransferase family protein [Verrucomicrobiae bacterium]